VTNSLRLGMPISSSMGNFHAERFFQRMLQLESHEGNRGPRLLMDSSGSSSGASSAITCARFF